MDSYDQLVSFINQKTNELSSKRYPKNLVHINQGLQDLEKLEKEVQDLQHKVDNAVSKIYDSIKKKGLLSQFNCLQELLAKTKHCLETMRDVSQLEENVTKLSNSFDKRSTQLSEHGEEENHNHEHISNIAGFIASSAQDCIFGLRDNWDWVVETVRCTLVHLKNASDYHKFFHEIEESEQWLDDDLKKFRESFDKHAVDGKPGDAQEIVKEIDAVNTSLRQWEARVTRLWNESTKLLPVPMRVTPIQSPSPGHVLTDYETNEIYVRNMEEILLLDNSDPNRWKIRNGKGQEGYVPPIIVIIPGPDQKCITAADRLRLHLLATWTNLLKRIGVRLICYTIAIFQPDYSQREIIALRSMEDLEKEKLMKILSDVENALKKYWADHEGFVNIQERIAALRFVLEEFGEEKTEDSADICRSLVVKIDALGQIIHIYQDLNKNWEKFKVSVETSRAPELMMIVDKWEQLQFVSREYFSKFWKMKLPLDEQEKKCMSVRFHTLEGIQFEDTIDMRPLGSPRPQSATITMVPKFPAFTTPEIKLTSIDDRVQFKVGIPSQQANENHITSATIMAKASYPTIRFTVDLHPQDNSEKITNEEGFDETKVIITSNRNNSENDIESREDGFTETKVFETRFGTRKNLQTAPVTDAVDHLFQRMASGYNDTDYTVTKGQIQETTMNTTNNHATTNKAKVGHSLNVSNNIQTAESPLQLTEEFGFDEIKEVTTRNRYSEESNDSTFAYSRPLARVGGSGNAEHEKWSSGDDEFSSLSRASGSDYEGTAFGIATETKTAETEQLSSAEVEENKTFVIGSVLNTSDNQDISLQQAILLGIIKPSEGVYVDGKTGRRIPIATAMSDGLIRVVHCRTKRSQEKFSSIGVITIKTIREMLRPYTVVWVKDTKTQEEVDPREACQRGILDEKQGYFIDKRTGEATLLVEAAEKGLTKIEYSDPVRAPEVIVKTYAVRAVVDRKLKKTITFHDAVRRGIIDKESGAFKDTVTGERMYVGDAIMRGFLKARLIEDPSGLNIDPQNKMVIDKTQKIKQKLLKPLQVISAFKAAAAAAAARRPGSAGSSESKK